MSELALQCARSVNRTDTRSESESASYTDVQAERVLTILKQWQTLADDCLRVGGWTTSVRIRATKAAELAAMASAFRGAHGDLVHVSHPSRRQAWRIAPTTSGMPESATWVSAYEVADLMIFGGASVGRIQARRALASGRKTSTGTQAIDLGSWLGSAVPARIDVSDLSAHGFISGITGSGKSTTTRTLLAQLWNRHRVPFLVIDPAKTDYADFGRHLSSELRVVQGRDLAMNVLRGMAGVRCRPTHRPSRQRVPRLVCDALAGAVRGLHPVRRAGSGGSAQRSDSARRLGPAGFADRRTPVSRRN